MDVPRDELDVPECVLSGQVFRWQVRADGIAEGVIGAHWYRILPAATGYAVETNAARPDFERLFRMDSDLGAIRGRFAAAMPSAPLALRSGLRLMRPGCPRESLITFLCSANNHLKRIMPMARVLGEFGPALEAPFPAHAFPSWDTLADLPESELRARRFGYRAPRIPAVARAVRDRGGDDWLAALASCALAEIRAELQTLPGVGPKLADCIALYALDRTDAVPIDTHLWQAATRHFFPEWDGLALTAARYAAVGDAFALRFGPDAGWAQLFLYRENQVNRPRTRRAAP
ncbi:MAG: hypothetical protein SFX74_01415 [Fimbriimonadaceae bacterium]|nr:hypothetical protein [Fimbriimonadaceae bacterium]